MVQAITSSCYDNDSWRMAIINEIGMDDGSSLKADPARPGDVKIAVVITAVNFLTLYFSYSHWQLVGRLCSHGDEWYKTMAKVCSFDT